MRGSRRRRRKAISMRRDKRMIRGWRMDTKKRGVGPGGAGRRERMKNKNKGRRKKQE